MQEIAKTDDFHLTADALKAKQQMAKNDLDKTMSAAQRERYKADTNSVLKGYRWWIDWSPERGKYDPRYTGIGPDKPDASN